MNQSTVFIKNLFLSLIFAHMLLLLSCAQINSDESEHISRGSKLYYPESLSQIEEDTTLFLGKNTINIRLNRFTVENSFVRKLANYENHVDTIFYRNWEVEVEILKEGKITFKDTLSKDSFDEIIKDDAFLKNAIIHNVWVEEFTTQLILRAVVSEPDSDFNILFKIIPNGSKGFLISEIDY